MSDIEAKPIKILTREAIGKLTRIVFDLTDYAKNFFHSRFLSQSAFINQITTKVKRILSHGRFN